MAVKRKEIWDIFSSNMMFILFYFTLSVRCMRSSFCFLPHLVTAHTFRATGHFHFMLIALFRFEDYFTYLFAASVYVCFTLCCTTGQDSATVFEYFVVMALTKGKKKTNLNRRMWHSRSQNVHKRHTKNHFISRTEKHSLNSFRLHQTSSNMTH